MFVLCVCVCYVFNCVDEADNTNLLHACTVEPLYSGRHWGMKFWPI